MSYVRYHDDPVGEPQKPRRSPLGLIKLLAIGVCAYFVIQSTYAANITLNTGSPKEFGQGVQVTSACSGNTSLSLAPSNTFVNASGAGAYKLSAVTVSNIPSSCYGVDFKFQVYDSATSSTPLAIFGATNPSAIIYNNSGTFTKGTGSGYTVTTLSGTSFKVEFTSPVALTNDIGEFTIQSQDHAMYYGFGDTGPTGGIIVITPTSEGGYGGSYYYEMAPADSSLGNVVQCNADAFQMRGYNNQDRAVGEGRTNTTNLLALCTSGAANNATAYTFGGKSDWFLPSFHEMYAICHYARQLPMADPSLLSCSGGTLRSGFASAYWTSTTGGTHSYGMAFTMSPANGDYTPANNTKAVRAIRRFTP